MRDYSHLSEIFTRTESSAGCEDSCDDCGSGNAMLCFGEVTKNSSHADKLYRPLHKLLDNEKLCRFAEVSHDLRAFPIMKGSLIICGICATITSWNERGSTKQKPAFIRVALL